ncbi:hypothetical protein CPLU01_11603 [Colletotrichum plurivorum]|uniref:Uncharacterized protein n=1 Tax=Colletotrichum plurivorum TaxID=2175906 RepID=A0A8H6K0Y5_9PEZI|nr:hypothetical protein CPLU01_11603 [Colletotrichum plurivorum]
MVRLMSAAVLALAVSPGLVSAEPFPEHRRPQPQPEQRHAASSTTTEESFAPSIDRARENAIHVFNAVHSAMRQWGSSLHHNGLGLIPATIPRGTTLYHGSRSNSTPAGPEWLAFEVEHSEGFARSFRGGRGSPPPRSPGKGPPPGERPPPVVVVARDGGQVPMAAEDDGRDKAVRGYFHTYRANRDLRLLYIDGMAAGKTDMGTLDTQDFLLRGLQTAPGFGEYERARDLCDIVTPWGLDGVIRMEIGFEAIYCDFFSGLDFLGALRRPWSDQIEGERGGSDMFEWTRAVGQRYDGIGGGRVRLDWGSVVSGFWYPLDVRNPEREDMPRLGTVTASQRDVILGRVTEVLEKGPEGRVDWQGVVDMIVTRHADRIEAMADEEGDEEGFVSQALVVTNTFVDYPRDASDARVLEDELSRAARERCVAHFLTPAAVWQDAFTPEDELVYAAVEEVTTRICGAIFAVRSLLLSAAPKLASPAGFSSAGILDILSEQDDDKMGDAVKAGRQVYQKLKKDLNWSLWKKCKPGCGVAEVCFVAMWPFGLKEDHYSPSCRNRTAMTGRRAGPGDGERYWNLNRRN